MKNCNKKVGEIYKVIFSKTRYYLCRITDTLDGMNNIEIESHNKEFYKFYKGSGDFRGRENEFIEATPEEKLWFEECERKGDIVTKPITFTEIY